MNKNNCRTGNEQSVGCAHMTEWSSTDYQLWNSVTIKQGMMVRNPFKVQNGKNWYKNLEREKKSSPTGKHFRCELHMWEYLT
jgi:hypothetical protein